MGIAPNLGRPRGLRKPARTAAALRPAVLPRHCSLGRCRRAGFGWRASGANSSPTGRGGRRSRPDSAPHVQLDRRHSHNQSHDCGGNRAPNDDPCLPILIAPSELRKIVVDVRLRAACDLIMLGAQILIRECPQFCQGPAIRLTARSSPATIGVRRLVLRRRTARPTTAARAVRSAPSRSWLTIICWPRGSKPASALSGSRATVRQTPSPRQSARSTSRCPGRRRCGGS